MVRCVALLALLCPACAFDSSVSIEDEPGDNPEISDPGPDEQGLDPSGPECLSEVTLVASMQYQPQVLAQDAAVELPLPSTFDLPRDLEVTAGNSGDHCAYLDIDRDGQDRIRCAFRGDAQSSFEDGFPHSFNGSGGSGSSGDEYDFVECRSGTDASFDFCGGENRGALLNYQIGDPVTADALILSVEKGDSDMGTTVVELVLAVTCS